MHLLHGSTGQIGNGIDVGEKHVFHLISNVPNSAVCEGGVSAW